MIFFVLIYSTYIHVLYYSYESFLCYINIFNCDNCIVFYLIFNPKSLFAFEIVFRSLSFLLFISAQRNLLRARARIYVCTHERTKKKKKKIYFSSKRFIWSIYRINSWYLFHQLGRDVSLSTNFTSWVDCSVTFYRTNHVTVSRN